MEFAKGPAESVLALDCPRGAPHNNASVPFCGWIPGSLLSTDGIQINDKQNSALLTINPSQPMTACA